MSATEENRPSPDGVVPDLTPEALDRLLSAPNAPPLLLDLWAPWCQPCLAQAPILQRLAAVTAGRLRVVKLDIQQHPGVAEGLKVRGIPALVLFRNGHEVARLSGQRSFEQLCSWVDEKGDETVVDTSVPAFKPPPPLGGAFYGDEGLRGFLRDRALALAAEGNIENPRFPAWTGDRGSVSCAIVRHQDPEVFARITGLPAVVGFCLHFVDVATPEAIKATFEAIPVGADVRGVAPRLLLRWLADDTLPWPAHLGPDAERVRLDWLRMCRDWLDGEPPLPDEWTALASRAQALMLPDANRSVQHHFGQMMSRLSPPPSPDEATWGGLLMMYGTFQQVTLVQREMGWTDEDFAVEVSRERWFKSRCADPGAISDEERDALVAEYEAGHAAIEAEQGHRMQRFCDEYPERMTPKRRRLQAQLIESLREVQAP